MFREYFEYQNTSYIYENLNSTKNTERNDVQVNSIENALTDLKNKIKNMFINETGLLKIFCWRGYYWKHSWF